MSKLIQMVGRKFGRLTVISRASTYPHNRNATWKCQCVCGNTRIVEAQSLRTGNTKSCGCFRVDKSKKTIKHLHDGRSNWKHGAAIHAKEWPEYRSWLHMRERCLKSNAKDWPRWGGRGITICKRWDDFMNFYKDMGQRPGPGYSIDRINNHGNYEPGNCRWATAKQQANNRG